MTGGDSVEEDIARVCSQEVSVRFIRLYQGRRDGGCPTERIREKEGAVTTDVQLRTQGLHRPQRLGQEDSP